MREKEATPAAQQALAACAAALWKHTEGKEPEFLCMATHIGDGMFATVYDRGAENTKWGEERYTDLRLHLLDGSGRVIWGDWATKSPLAPILLIQSRGADDLPTPEFTSMGEMAQKEYTDVFRIGFERYLDRKEVRTQAAAENRFMISTGCTIHDPEMGWYRSGADEPTKSDGSRPMSADTVNVHCAFDYPGRTDLGSPVVDSRGRIAGVLIGGDLGPDIGNQGSYMPIDMILPFADLSRSLRERRNGRSLAFSGMWQVVHHEDEHDLAMRLR